MSSTAAGMKGKASQKMALDLLGRPELASSSAAEHGMSASLSEAKSESKSLQAARVRLSKLLEDLKLLTAETAGLAACPTCPPWRAGRPAHLRPPCQQGVEGCVQEGGCYLSRACAVRALASALEACSPEMEASRLASLEASAASAASVGHLGVDLQRRDACCDVEGVLVHRRLEAVVGCLMAAVVDQLVGETCGPRALQRCDAAPVRSHLPVCGGQGCCRGQRHYCPRQCRPALKPALRSSRDRVAPSCPAVTCVPSITSPTTSLQRLYSVARRSPMGRGGGRGHVPIFEPPAPLVIRAQGKLCPLGVRGRGAKSRSPGGRDGELPGLLPGAVGARPHPLRHAARGWDAMLRHSHSPHHRRAGPQGRAGLRHGWAELHLPALRSSQQPRAGEEDYNPEEPVSWISYLGFNCTRPQ